MIGGGRSDEGWKARLIGARLAICTACRLPGLAGMALLAAGLAGCAGIGEQTVSSAMVAPGKFEFYRCPDIESNIKTRRTRQAELEKLMARSSEGFGGELVNVIAYRSEYLQTRGELDELAREAEAKRCVSQSQWSSVRAVF